MIFLSVCCLVISSAHAVEVKLGETISHDGLELSFYDIEDSRCPLDVTCVWEGEVIARTLMQNQTHDYYEDFGIGTTISTIFPYNVTLIEVIPHPITTQTPNYVAIFDIINFDYVEKIDAKKSKALPPIKQFKDNIPYHEIKCNTGLQLTQKHDGTPACVKPDTFFELIKRGWVSNLIRSIQSIDLEDLNS